jgi:hypothetical protein
MSELNENKSDDFAKFIEDWRKQHQLRADEPLLLCLELFRIHQSHWDELRRKDLPSFTELHDSLLKFRQEAAAVQREVIALMEQLSKQPKPSRFITPTLGGLLLTALFSVLTGILIGIFIL